MKKLITLVSILALTACATPSPYKQIRQTRLHHSENTLGMKFSSIAQVNSFVNSLPYRDTHEWTQPEKFIRTGGDCRGYVLTKRRLILENDLANESDMHILLVKPANDKIYHVVLEVGDVSLDNRVQEILPLNSPKFNLFYTVLGEEVAQ